MATSAGPDSGTGAPVGETTLTFEFPDTLEPLDGGMPMDSDAGMDAGDSGMGADADTPI
jgi:hypothetical protein